MLALIRFIDDESNESEIEDFIGLFNTIEEIKDYVGEKINLEKPSKRIYAPKENCKLLFIAEESEKFTYYVYESIC